MDESQDSTERFDGDERLSYIEENETLPNAFDMEYYRVKDSNVCDSTSKGACVKTDATCYMVKVLRRYSNVQEVFSSVDSVAVRLANGSSFFKKLEISTSFALEARFMDEEISEAV
ncbi:hypothetical protein LXL04_023576 [Taraxacum kok-saghyz]